MEQLRKILEENIDKNMLRATLSSRRHGDIADKVKIHPLLLKGELYFQAVTTDGKKEFHKNYTGEELRRQILEWMTLDYKQLQMDTVSRDIHVLASKKGKVTVKIHEMMRPRKAQVREHNRKKCYILEEGIPVPFLVDLGVMTPEGKVVKARYDKFRQINRFLEFVEDVLPALDGQREQTIIDFGCGKSYLTFAMYYYLRILKNLNVRMIGLDLKEDVISQCSELAAKYGYDKLEFLIGDIASYQGVEQVDMVVTLHACDTATDYALSKAVQWGARVILSVPCCQHELNGQICSETMQPVLKYGLIRERMAALLTDAFRAGLLEEQGYQVQILEFIDMEHTPKNILIRAVRKNKAEPRREEKLAVCMREWNARPLLDELLNGRTR